MSASGVHETCVAIAQDPKSSYDEIYARIKLVIQNSTNIDWDELALIFQSKLKKLPVSNHAINPLAVKNVIDKHAMLKTIVSSNILNTEDVHGFVGFVIDVVRTWDRGSTCKKRKVKELKDAVLSPFRKCSLHFLTQVSELRAEQNTLAHDGISACKLLFTDRADDTIVWQDSIKCGGKYDRNRMPKLVDRCTSLVQSLIARGYDDHRLMENAIELVLHSMLKNCSKDVIKCVIEASLKSCNLS